MKKYWMIVVAACCSASLAVAGAGGGSGSDMSAADGLIQFEPPQVRGCVAARVDVPADKMVVGVRWYNGSSVGALPKILVATGNGLAPPAYGEAVALAEDVQGQEQEWSNVVFASPVASESGTLFIIVEYPANYAAPVEGSALGVGYADEAAAYPYFVSGDGEMWIRVSSRCRVLLEPVLADRIPGAVALRGPAEDGRDIPLEKLGLYAAPNPFNPQTSIALYLKSASVGELRVYDVRGRLVTELYSGPLAQGPNNFTWKGIDSAGRAVSSGAYWVQARTSDQSLTIKVLLLR